MATIPHALALGADPNGEWALFFADRSPGGTSTVLGWGLEVKAVPQPVNLALGIFGVLLASFGLRRRFRVR